MLWLFDCLTHFVDNVQQSRPDGSMGCVHTFMRLYFLGFLSIYLLNPRGACFSPEMAHRVWVRTWVRWFGCGEVGGEHETRMCWWWRPSFVAFMCKFKHLRLLTPCRSWKKEGERGWSWCWRRKERAVEQVEPTWLVLLRRGSCTFVLVTLLGSLRRGTTTEDWL